MNRKARRILRSIGLTNPKKDIKERNELLQEYYKTCAEAGELQYKIEEFQNELNKLNQKIRKLNRANVEIMAEQRAAAPSSNEGEAPSTSPSPSGETA